MKVLRSAMYIAVIVFCTVLSGCVDPYASLLEKQGYTVVDHPRSDFGTGTIIRILDNHNELLVSAPNECFPGIEGKIHTNPIVLVNSKKTSNLSIDAGAKYVPGGVQQVGGSFGFKSIKNLDVSFGKTTGNDLTVEGLAEYLDGKTVSKRCYDYLNDQRNRVIVSAARVETMNYTFHGEKDVNVKVDAEALKETLKANGVITYTTTTDNTLTISQPMYIAYKSFVFKDLGIIHPESAEAPFNLKKGQFKLVPDPVYKKSEK